jgi:hypothetical protein
MYGDFGPWTKRYYADTYDYNDNEERLFYIGLTRASETITILQKASSDYPKDKCFLARIPEGLIQISTMSERTENVRTCESYSGKQCIHVDYGIGIVTEQTEQGLTIHYPNYSGGHFEFVSLDEIDWIDWKT